MPEEVPQRAEEWPRSLRELLAYLEKCQDECDVDMRDLIAMRGQGVDFTHPSYRLATRDGMASAYYDVWRILSALLED